MTDKERIISSYNENTLSTYTRMKTNFEDSQNALKDESCTAGACISPSIAGNQYNPLATEDDDAHVDNKVEDPKLNIVGHIGQKYSQFKDNHQNFAKVINSAKATAVKVKDFGKSSFGLLNSMPQKTIDSFAQAKLNEIKGDPNNLIGMLKQGIMGAGRKVAAGALCIACLPVGIAAIIANKQLDNNVKKKLLKDLENNYTKIEQDIEKAARDDDYDKKADLLIAQAETKKAINKLRFNLDMDPRDIHD